MSEVLYLCIWPELFVNLRNEMFKYQEMQVAADKFGAGNSELFSNKIWRGRLYCADR